MADFLFEIGLEEVPARMIAGAQAELTLRIVTMLEQQHLLPDHILAEGTAGCAKPYATPRRLAVWVKDVLVQQPDVTEEVTGPAVKIAFRDGVPTPAAEAFAKKNGIAVSELKTITNPKGEYLTATSVKKGRSAAEVIAEELPKQLTGIYWAKNMYWRAGKPERFVRPVMWMVCLLGDAVVPVSFGGKTAGRASFGHRVLSSGEAFEVQKPESYLAQLEGEYVIADVEARRQKIRKALDHVTRTVAGARWREDEALVDAVTHLTEWPDVLLGGFEAEYLKLPEEVLVTVMRDHQKYFAVEDASGKLAPHFLTVTNIALDEENAQIIRQGNERVLRARFNDAKFFWKFDQRTPLGERVKLLESVTFQKDLGSYAKKSERVLEISRILADFAQTRGRSIDVNALMNAARLAKADLTTELVKEFTELQGQIGGLYAQKEGFVDATWHAIYYQYLPASSKDPIPRGPEGCLLGLSDRIDTIRGLFSLGMVPTGSKDPFALRRAANAIVRILAESSLPLKLSEVISASSPTPEVEVAIKNFFIERIDFYLREGRDQAYDVVKAAMAAGTDDLQDLVARAEAVTAVRGGEDFLAVSAAFKRMKNILAQAVSTGAKFGRNADSDSHPATVSLRESAKEASGRFANLASERSYVKALEAIAALRPEIDSFFEQVMVMDPDEAIRAARLSLLSETVQTFSAIGDFSEIVAAG